ncbi:hypothetical protein NQ318_020766, partial [Aromia moschata]
YVDVTSVDFGIINFGENKNAKIWSPVYDTLKYKITNASETRISKRSILSHIAQIFNPLGLLAPCVVLAKISMQRLWLEKTTWDETIPPHIYACRRDFRRELPVLNELMIDRRVTCDEPIRVEMHGFSDASENAYGGCIYVRSLDKDRNIFCFLLCAKSKISPLKSVTLPRLELMGAENLPDMRKPKKNIFAAPCTEENFIKKYSNLDKLTRIVAYIMRFCNNCKLKDRENLSTSPIPRVFCVETKHPSILSSQSYLAQLIVRRTHLRLLHAGPQHTVAAIREEYWIIGGRILVSNKLFENAFHDSSIDPN